MLEPQSKWALHPIELFDDFVSAWDRVNASSSGPPFLRALFIRNLLKVFRTGSERLVVLGEPGNEQALGIVNNVRGGWQTYQPSQLPLGAWVMTADSEYPHLLGTLLKALPGKPLLLAASQQDPFVHPRPADSARLRTVDYIDTGWIEVAGSFESYWNSRSKRLRQNMRTQRSKLAAQGLTATLEVITRPEKVADAISDYARLETASWKGAAGSAVRADSDQGRFYCEMLEDFCRVGDGRIYRYRFGDRVVAVDLCIESQATQILLKTTYDESCKGFSPSTLLRQDAYRDVFDEGRIRRIEFFGRFMEWTARWTDQRRTLYHVNAYRWRVLPVAASQFARLRIALRRGGAVG